MNQIASTPAAPATTAFADPCDARLALRAPGLLRVFNAAGVLHAADVHAALRLGRFGDETREAVLLAAALAVRGPRLGHVHVDLATVRQTATVDVDVPIDLQTLPWPEVDPWVEVVSQSAFVARGEDAPGDRPLRLIGSWLYLDRYWREERQVAGDLAVRAEGGVADIDAARLRGGLDRLFPVGAAPADVGGEHTGEVSSVQLFPTGSDTATDRQRLAAAVAVLRLLTVVAGGPGTGKTTTVARILALLYEQAETAGAPPPLVALTAPTGKAAARLEEAVHEESGRLQVADAVRQHLLGTHASTLHRLLGWQPGNRSRFRHNRGNRLPHDVVVVDETSMVSLTQMARLAEAVRPDARLILVGDPQQLASVEAGAVLGNIVGPAAERFAMRPEARGVLEVAAGVPVDDPGEPAVGGEGPAMGDGIVVLRRVHRFGGGIAALADAVRRGDADGAVDALSAGAEVVWIPADLGAGSTALLKPVREAAVEAGATIADAASVGDARRALGALGGFRVLCAHRRGPYGVATWSAQIEAWLAAEIAGFALTTPWYAGRPLLVTENDYNLGLYNGDTGVVVAAGGERLTAVFERRGDIVEFSPAQLSAVETVHVMTVHKSQGSQFDTVATLLPGADSPILTRELLYTAITRARRRLLLAGTEEAVRAAVNRPVARSSGLRRWVWGDPPQ